MDWKRARRRNWTTYWAVLQHPRLFLFKDRGPGPKSTRDLAPKEVVLLTANSFVDVASDYKKRRHVFRLLPVPGTELLFEARDDADLDRWLHAVVSCVQQVRMRMRCRARTSRGR